MALLTGDLKVTLPGEEYIWQPDEMTLGEMSMCLDQELGGMTFADWMRGIINNQPIPCQVLVWYLRLKAGRQEDRTSVNFPIRKLDVDLVPKDEPNSSNSDPSTSDSSPEPDTGPPISTP